MTQNPYQSPHEPGADRSPRRPSRWRRMLVGIVLLLGGFYVFEFGHVLLAWSRSEQDSILLKIGSGLVSLVGLGMIATACLMGVGLIWRLPARENDNDNK